MGAADSKPINKLFEHYTQINVHNNDFPECKILYNKYAVDDRIYLMKNIQSIVQLKSIQKVNFTYSNINMILINNQSYVPSILQMKIILRRLFISFRVDKRLIILMFQISTITFMNLNNNYVDSFTRLTYYLNILKQFRKSIHHHQLFTIQTINEIQLIDYLRQAISGLACMQKNQISHNTLQLRYLFLMNGVVKVSDPQYFQQNTNYVLQLQNPNCMESIYLSPTLVNTIRTNNWWPKHNQYKSDLFTLGMLFLHLSLNQVNSDCYNYIQGKFLEDQLTIKLQKLRTRFGQQYCDLISMMLIIQEDQRPDLIQMEQIINQQGKSYYSQQQVPNVVPRQAIQAQPIGQMETIHQPNSNSLQLEFAYNTQNNQSRRINQVQTISPIEYAHQYTIKTNSSQRSSTPVSKYTIPIQQVQLQTRDSSLPKQKTQSQNASSRQINYEYQNKNNQPQTLNKNNAIITTTTTTDQSILSNKSSIQQISLPPKQQRHQKNSKSAQVNQQTESNILPIQVFPVSQDQCDFLSKIFPSEMCSKHSKFDVNLDAQQDEDINTQRQGKFESSKILSDSTNLPQQIKNTITKEFSLPCETSQIKVEKAEGAEFAVEHYGNGSRYEGMKINGMRHGQGRFYYQDGGLYDGEWKENKMHGEGTVEYLLDLIKQLDENCVLTENYIMEQASRHMRGSGTRINFTVLGLCIMSILRCWRSPLIIGTLIMWRSKSCSDNYSYWIKYSGNFWMDNKEGQGSLHLTNGERFVGQFERDLVNGKGVFYRMDGKMMEGRWVDNKLVY